MDEILQELLEAIKDSQKEIKEAQKEIQTDINLIKEDLRVHIYRTNLLEEDLKSQKQENSDNFKKIEEEFKPIYQHINMVKGGAALIGLLLTIFTILSLLKII